jgi:hypothetical protein
MTLTFFCFQKYNMGYKKISGFQKIASQIDKCQEKKKKALHSSSKFACKFEYKFFRSIYLKSLQQF